MTSEALESKKTYLKLLHLVQTTYSVNIGLGVCKILCNYLTYFSRYSGKCRVAITTCTLAWTQEIWHCLPQSRLSGITVLFALRNVQAINICTPVKCPSYDKERGKTNRLSRALVQHPLNSSWKNTQTATAYIHRDVWLSAQCTYQS